MYFAVVNATVVIRVDPQPFSHPIKIVVSVTRFVTVIFRVKVIYYPIPFSVIISVNPEFLSRSVFIHIDVSLLGYAITIFINEDMILFPISILIFTPYTLAWNLLSRNQGGIGYECRKKDAKNQDIDPKPVSFHAAEPFFAPSVWGFEALLLVFSLIMCSLSHNVNK